MSTLEQEIASWAKSGPLPEGIAVNHAEPRATFWIQATKGVTYYRATLPARYLPGKLCALNDMDLTEAGMPRQQGHAIWSFPGNNTRALLIAMLQGQGIPCWFECDDNYTMPPDIRESSSWLTRYEGNDRHSYEIACRVVRYCDGVIVSTPKLGEVYSDMNDNVHVARNCIDPTDWDELDKPDDGILRIGWAASASHARDAHLLKPALRWLAGRENVEIIILGLAPNYNFPYTHIRWTESLSDYRKLLQVLDVMLCPVRRTEWSDCKSDVKALEGAMAGAMAVVSDSPSYDLWQDRTFVCETEKDWLRVAKHLYRNREEVREQQDAHRAYVLNERTIQKGVRQWENALQSLT